MSVIFAYTDPNEGYIWIYFLQLVQCCNIMNTDGRHHEALYIKSGIYCLGTSREMTIFVPLKKDSKRFFNWCAANDGLRKCI